MSAGCTSRGPALRDDPRGDFGYQPDAASEPYSSAKSSGSTPCNSGGRSLNSTTLRRRACESALRALKAASWTLGGQVGNSGLHAPLSGLCAAFNLDLLLRDGDVVEHHPPVLISVIQGLEVGDLRLFAATECVRDLRLPSVKRCQFPLKRRKLANPIDALGVRVFGPSVWPRSSRVGSPQVAVGFHQPQPRS